MDICRCFYQNYAKILSKIHLYVSLHTDNTSANNVMKIISPSITILMKGRDIMNWLERYMDVLDFKESDNRHDKTLKIVSKKACMQRVFFMLSAVVNRYDII